MDDAIECILPLISDRIGNRSGRYALAQFLYLAATLRDKTLMPGIQLHELWHALILDTCAYADICNRLHANIMHYPENDDAPLETKAKWYDETKEKLFALTGPFENTWWPHRYYPVITHYLFITGPSGEHMGVHAAKEMIIAIFKDNIRRVAGPSFVSVQFFTGDTELDDTKTIGEYDWSLVRANVVYQK